MDEGEGGRGGGETAAAAHMRSTSYNLSGAANRKAIHSSPPVLDTRGELCAPSLEGAGGEPWSSKLGSLGTLGL